MSVIPHGHHDAAVSAGGTHLIDSLWGLLHPPEQEPPPPEEPFVDPAAI